MTLQALEQVKASASVLAFGGNFQQHGRLLLGNGYLIIPIKPGYKRPALDHWQTARLGAADLTRYPGHGVGVLCGQGAQPVAAIDVDTTDADLAARFVAWCQEHLGVTCERVGNAPKILLAYRAAAEGWGKATGAWFEDLAGVRHRLEILGKGQQFVAYHIHPDTGRPYEWVDFLGGLDAVRASDLPVITEAQVEEALQVFEQMAVDAGLARITGSKSRTGLASAPEDDPLMAYEPPVGIDLAEARRLVAYVDNEDYDTWLKVGMSLHHEFDGSDEALALWDEWSATASNYASSDDVARRWDSFGRSGRNPMTARWLLKAAKEGGAVLKTAVGSAADFGQISAEHSDTLRFPVVPAGEFAQGDPPGWIIKNVIPRAELVVLFGESGSGKSFLVLDMGVAVARGVSWRDQRTRQGRVVYIAAEGGGGFRSRLKAYEQQHGISLAGLPFGVIHAAPNFLQKADAVDVARAIAASGGADLVIVDTFAQVTPGANENASEGMSVALAHCRGIHRATGAAVVLVHHAGKDPTRGARGWSGLRAAADAELEVLRLATGRMVRVSKQKDGRDGLEWGFDLLTVPVGVDEDGDVIESCVVQEAEIPLIGRIGSRGRRPAGKWEQLVQEVVGEIALGQNTGIEVGQVLDEVVRRSPPVAAGQRDTRRQHARRALKALSEGDEAPYFIEEDCLSVLA